MNFSIVKNTNQFEQNTVSNELPIQTLCILLIRIQIEPHYIHHTCKMSTRNCLSPNSGNSIERVNATICRDETNQDLRGRNVRSKEEVEASDVSCTCSKSDEINSDKFKGSLLNANSDCQCNQQSTLIEQHESSCNCSVNQIISAGDSKMNIKEGRPVDEKPIKKSALQEDCQYEDNIEIDTCTKYKQGELEFGASNQKRDVERISNRRDVDSSRVNKSLPSCNKNTTDCYNTSCSFLNSLNCRKYAEPQSSCTRATCPKRLTYTKVDRNNENNDIEIANTISNRNECYQDLRCPNARGIVETIEPSFTCLKSEGINNDMFKGSHLNANSDCQCNQQSTLIEHHESSCNCSVNQLINAGDSKRNLDENPIKKSALQKDCQFEHNLEIDTCTKYKQGELEFGAFNQKRDVERVSSRRDVDSSHVNKSVPSCNKNTTDCNNESCSFLNSIKCRNYAEPQSSCTRATCPKRLTYPKVHRSNENNDIEIAKTISNRNECNQQLRCPNTRGIVETIEPSFTCLKSEGINNDMFKGSLLNANSDCQCNQQCTLIEHHESSCNCSVNQIINAGDSKRNLDEKPIKKSALQKDCQFEDNLEIDTCTKYTQGELEFGAYNHKRGVERVSSRRDVDSSHVNKSEPSCNKITADCYNKPCSFLNSTNCRNYAEPQSSCTRATCPKRLTYPKVDRSNENNDIEIAKTISNRNECNQDLRCPNARGIVETIGPSFNCLKAEGINDTNKRSSLNSNSIFPCSQRFDLIEQRGSVCSCNVNEIITNGHENTNLYKREGVSQNNQNGKPNRKSVLLDDCQIQNNMKIEKPPASCKEMHAVEPEFCSVGRVSNRGDVNFCRGSENISSCNMNAADCYSKPCSALNRRNCRNYSERQPSCTKATCPKRLNYPKVDRNIQTGKLCVNSTKTKMPEKFDIPPKRAPTMDDRYLKRLLHFDSNQSSICNKNVQFCVYSVHPSNKAVKTKRCKKCLECCDKCPGNTKCKVAICGKIDRVLCNEILVEVEYLQLTTTAVSKLTRVCNFVYIDYTFLGHIGVETQNGPISNDKIFYDSKKSFCVSMKYNRKQRSILREQLKPTGLLARNDVRFILVCQAAHEKDVLKNWDYGYGDLNMSSILDGSGDANAVQRSVEMVCIGGKKKIGNLFIKMTGLNLMRTIRDEYLECAEEPMGSLWKKLPHKNRCTKPNAN